MATHSIAHKSDHVLLHDLGTIVERDRTTTAEMLAHIAEVDARGVYRAAAYPNMYQYCLGELHMSEDEAFKRIRVARVTRDFPMLLEMLGDGRLHLSGALTLAPALTRDTAAGLLQAAAHQTRARIEQLLAERFPKPDAPTVLRELRTPSPTALAPEMGQESAPAELAVGLGLAAPREVSQDGPASACAHSLAPGRPVPSSSPANAPAEVPLGGRDRIAPLSAGRYELRTTLDQETHDLLRQLQALLAHAIPSGDVPELLKRALKLAVQDAERRRYAATSKPGTKRRSKNLRHIPADVRRDVHKRDGGQCTFVSTAGRRCAETRFLEYDHVHPVARGGQATITNTRLRCRAHNQLEAERTYGSGFMREKREAAKHRAESASMLRGVAAERARMRVGGPGSVRA